MTDEKTTCPYCKEVIKPDAIKCKHCQSALASEQPDHGGTCPYGKEDIKADAIKCKHCHSDLRPQHQVCECQPKGCSGRDIPGVVYFDDSPQRPSPTGGWRCAPGKSYECGSLLSGGTMICCDEWIPDTTIGPAATHATRR